MYSRQLLRAEEEAVWRLAAAMVDPVRVADPREQRDLSEPPHGQAAMDEAVVEDEVAEAEERHADADAEERLAQRARRSGAAVEDQRDRDGRVQGGEGVVGFEAAAALAMVRAVNRPQHSMPEAAVQHAGPQLHRGGDDEGDRDPDRGGRHHGAFFRRGAR